MNNQIDNLNHDNDKAPIGWQILAFIVPIAGFIMALNNHNKFPSKAKRYRMLAIIAIIIGGIARLID